MLGSVLIQMRIDADVKQLAEAVFESMGLSLSDAVRLLLARTARQGIAPLELVIEQEEYDTWFSDRVEEALTSDQPDIPDEELSRTFSHFRDRARNGVKPL